MRSNIVYALRNTRYLTGSRTLDTHIYKLGCYPFDLIGPVTVMWQPGPNGKTTSSAIQSNKMKGKGKEKAQDTPNEQTQPICVRSVWLRFHPCIHIDILDTLKEAASQTLAEYKARNPATDELKMEIIDRRQQVNIFEIMGPKSSQILKGVLRPVMPDNRSDFLKVHSPFSEHPPIIDMIPSFGMSSAVCKVRLQFQGE
jgi:ribonuclease P/MRP protein subunit POP1